MKKTKLALAALAAVASIAAPAQAASSSSATLSDLTVTLYSIGNSAPMITFSNASEYIPFNYAHARDTASGLVSSNSSYTVAAVSANAAGSNAVATGGELAIGNLVSRSAYGSTSGPSASSNNGNFNQGYYGEYSATSSQDYSSFSSFTLSANTVAVFSAKSSVSANTTVGATPVDSEYSAAQTYFSVSGSNGFNGSQTSNDGMWASASAVEVGFDPIRGNYLFSGQSDVKTGTLKASFSNTTNGDLTGQFYSSVNVYGESYIAAVPEPEIYAMLLAGLGLMGAIARRRNAKQTS